MRDEGWIEAGLSIMLRVGEVGKPSWWLYLKAFLRANGAWRWLVNEAVAA